MHCTNAVCSNCHKILDPIGFGLENFDAIGRWRDQHDTGGKGVEGFCLSKLNRREEAVSLLLEGIAGLEKERT